MITAYVLIVMHGSYMSQGLTHTHMQEFNSEAKCKNAIVEIEKAAPLGWNRKGERIMICVPK